MLPHVGKVHVQPLIRYGQVKVWSLALPNFCPAALPFLKFQLLPFRLGLDGVAGGELAFQYRETERIQ
jgi:hypothetical protein